MSLILKIQHWKANNYCFNSLYVLLTRVKEINNRMDYFWNTKNTNFKNMLCPFIIWSGVFAGFLVDDDMKSMMFICQTVSLVFSIAISLSGLISELFLQFPFSWISLHSIVLIFHFSNFTVGTASFYSWNILQLPSSFQFHHSVVFNSATPWTAACQASLSTYSRILLKIISI